MILTNEDCGFALYDNFIALICADSFERQDWLVFANCGNGDACGHPVSGKNRRDELKSLAKINATLSGQLVGDGCRN